MPCDALTAFFPKFKKWTVKMFLSVQVCTFENFVLYVRLIDEL